MLKEPNLAKEAGQGLLGIVSSYARGDLGGVASTAMSFFKKATTGDETYQRNLRTKTSPADVIMWSGSKDSQTSYVAPMLPNQPMFMINDAFMLPSEQCHTPFHEAYVPHRDMSGNILL